MTTWTTFQTLDEMKKENGEAFCVDRLGCHQFREDERTRFIFTKGTDSFWNCQDQQPEEDQSSACHGSMRDCVCWMSARVLYGA
jgi:hypothetical protein